jgi:hypothetical protein
MNLVLTRYPVHYADYFVHKLANIRLNNYYYYSLAYWCGYYFAYRYFNAWVRKLLTRFTIELSAAFPTQNQSFRSGR